jgi:DNA excision repair protein ERCC-4
LKPRTSLGACQRRRFGRFFLAVLLYLLQSNVLLIAHEQDDLTKLSSLNRQATELYQAGKFNDAISIQQEFLELSEKALGPEHPVQDSREQLPLVFKRFASIKGTLNAGDYSIRGLENYFAIERKSVEDFANCCRGDNRERFERELHRLRGYRFKRLLVVGSESEILAGQYHSNIKPKAVMATLCAFEVRYDLPVVFAATAEDGARLIERWTFFFAREAVQVVNDLWRAT